MALTLHGHCYHNLGNIETALEFYDLGDPSYEIYMAITNHEGYNVPVIIYHTLIYPDGDEDQSGGTGHSPLQ